MKKILLTTICIFLFTAFCFAESEPIKLISFDGDIEFCGYAYEYNETYIWVYDVDDNHNYIYKLNGKRLEEVAKVAFKYKEDPEYNIKSGTLTSKQIAYIYECLIGSMIAQRLTKEGKVESFYFDYDVELPVSGDKKILIKINPAYNVIYSYDIVFINGGKEHSMAKDDDLASVMFFNFAIDGKNDKVYFPSEGNIRKYDFATDKISVVAAYNKKTGQRLDAPYLVPNTNLLIYAGFNENRNGSAGATIYLKELK